MDTMPYEAEVALAAHKEVRASPAPSPSSGICKCTTLVLGEDPSLKPPCTCSQPSAAHTPAQQDKHDTALEPATSTTEEDQKETSATEEDQKETSATEEDQQHWKQFADSTTNPQFQKMKQFLQEAKQKQLADEATLAAAAELPLENLPASKPLQHAALAETPVAATTLDAKDEALKELQHAAASAEAVAEQDANSGLLQQQEMGGEAETKKTAAEPINKNCKVGSHVLPAGWTALSHISPAEQKRPKPKAKAKGKAKAAAKKTQNEEKEEPLPDAVEKPKKKRKAKASQDKEEEPTGEAASSKPKKKPRKPSQPKEEPEKAPQPKEAEAMPKKKPRKPSQPKEEPEKAPQPKEAEAMPKKKPRKPSQPKEDSEKATQSKEAEAEAMPKKKPRKASQPKEELEKPSQSKEAEAEAMPKKKPRKASQLEEPEKAPQPKEAEAMPKKKPRKTAEVQQQDSNSNAASSSKAVDPEVKALRSRKSSAYHTSFKHNTKQGMSIEEAKALAKKAAKLQNMQCTICFLRVIAIARNHPLKSFIWVTKAYAETT